MANCESRPLSLTQYFNAPEDYRSVFGWMCGYSADSLFLNEAIERFTRETKGQRASRGSVSLALMLDPGHPAIGPVEVPGLAHLPINRADVRPFRLLHAKVALLGFRHGSENGRWRVRLIVSTGNWTRQTLEESLDLGWSIELDSEELELDDDDLEQRCADIKAAWSMLTFLHELYDLRVLDAANDQGESASRRALTELEGWLGECGGRAGSHTRFIDNRHASFLAQLPQTIVTVSGGEKRNYLALGSGFFESSSPGGPAAVPGVLDGIVSGLVRAGLLIQSPGVDLFVNQAACQAVASSLPALIQRKWTVRAASKMECVFGRNAQRSLHAKFLFSARKVNGNNVCQRPWVYLGSGNLTRPGFASAMSREGGNLESGVVFAPDGLEWYPGTGVDPETLVTHFLPIQWDTEISQVGTLFAGTSMPQPLEPFEAPPVAWLTWRPIEEGGHLCAPSETLAGWEVLDAVGQPCARQNDDFVWFGSRPRQVGIRWVDAGRTHACLIPVLDEFGRLAATALTALNLDEAWWDLAGFPAVASDDDDGGTEDEEDPEPRTPGGGGGGGGVAAYPVRQMMELIERIAAQQTTVVPADWAAWCTRLEQTLSRVSESPVLDYFRTLGLNPLSPLRVPAFRPDYAEADDSAEGRLYEMVLARIEGRWDITGLTAIGECA